MSPVELQAVVDEVRERGPRRVMVSRHKAVAPSEARHRGVEPSVVFIRKDGWTLGAAGRLVEAARATWADDWIALLDLGAPASSALTHLRAAPAEAAP